mgnify:FL=1
MKKHNPTESDWMSASLHLSVIKVKEITKNYELFVVKYVKDELIKKELKPTLKNIGNIVDYIFMDNAISGGIVGRDNDDLTKYRTDTVYSGGVYNVPDDLVIIKEWYLENYELLNQMTLIKDPLYKSTSTSPLLTIIYCDVNGKEYEISFMNFAGDYYKDIDLNYGFLTITSFYMHCFSLYKRMKTSKKSYWFPMKKEQNG